MSAIELYTVASIERIYKDQRPQTALGACSCLLNETFHFQMALYSGEERTVRLSCQTELPVTLYAQKFVSGTSAPDIEGEFYERGRSSYADPLCPTDGVISLTAGEYCAVWVKVKAESAGEKSIVCVALNDGERVEKTVSLNVLPVETEKTDALLINWLHYDCICDKHGVEPFTDEFYAALGKYLDLYLEAGFNTVYAPLFTPPLDTEIGGERRTVQAVEIKKIKGKYLFDFSRLKKFIAFAKEKGIRYFEFSHLFTQWGANACPKIEGWVRGEKKRLFFWNDRSYGKKYKRFLSAFLRALVSFVKANGLTDVSFLHISDEPWWKYESNYFRLSKFVRKHSGKIKIMDAVSSDKFYKKGAQDIPVYPNLKGHLMRGDLPYLFYYACDSYADNLTNRFFYMPLLRTRVLGYQMSLNGAAGFLHWGFNFYNSQYSLRKIDPWLETDAGGKFHSGDSFIVYPYGDGVLPSIRLYVMQEAFYDYFALEALKKRRGKEFVIRFLTENGMEGVSKYPKDIETHLKIREKINRFLLDK